MGASVLSIVIPTLNAAATLPATLAALGCNPGAGLEVIVVDGGSTDGTQSLVTGLAAGQMDSALSPATPPGVAGCGDIVSDDIGKTAGDGGGSGRDGAGGGSSRIRLLIAPRGRGSQLASGIAAATGPWILLLHADTILSPGWRAMAAEHMASGADRAGYFGFRLDSTDRRARLLERLVAWRCRVFALPYGDQGLLIHRHLLAQVGGMRDIALMEDVDLIRRLGRKRLIPLSADATTSAAKWQRHGWVRRSACNLLCLSLWFAGVPPHVIRRLYG